MRGAVAGGSGDALPPDTQGFSAHRGLKRRKNADLIQPIQARKIKRKGIKMSVIEVKKDNFQKEVIESEKPVIADFNANWCGPCQMLKPIFHEMADENDKVKFVSINIDENPELAMQFNVSSIPCLLLINKGAEVKRSVGFIPKDAIESFIAD